MPELATSVQIAGLTLIELSKANRFNLLFQTYEPAKGPTTGFYCPSRPITHLYNKINNKNGLKNSIPIKEGTNTSNDTNKNLEAIGRKVEQIITN